MSGWTNFTSIAKSALSTAQKKIDTALDIRAIQEPDDSGSSPVISSTNVGIGKLRDDFLSAFGLQTTSNESTNEDVKVEENSSKSHSSWSSWLNMETPVRTHLQDSYQLDHPLSYNNDEAPDRTGCTTPTPFGIPTNALDSFLDMNTVRFRYIEDTILSPGAEVVVSTSSQLTLIDSDATFESFTNEEPRSSGSKTLLSFRFENDDSKMDKQTGLNVMNSQQLITAKQKHSECLDDIELKVHECLDHILNCVSSTCNSNSDQELLEPALMNSAMSEDQNQPVIKSSGYSSPFDDMETNASSDIEVMSTPNGDYGSESSFRSGIVWPVSANEYSRGKCKDRKLVSTHEDSPEAEKKLVQLSKILEMREKRLVDVSSENVKLSVENEHLRREIRDQCQNKTGVPALERDLNLLNKEKRRLEQRIEFLEKEMSTRISMQQFQQVVADKDRQIEELMREGEKLALKELKYTNIVKKLRETESDNAKMIKKQKAKLEEMDALKEQLKSKETQELNYDDTLAELRKIIEKQDKVIEKLRNELKDSEEKWSGYKKAMNHLNSENADLRRSLAEANKETEVLKSSFNESVRASLETQLEKIRHENVELSQKLTYEAESFKSQYSASLEDFQKREEMLKDELKRVELKLQESELRNQQLLENANNATKPLLHQIESLRASVQSQQANFERVEQSLLDKLVQAERSCAVWKEKEQSIRNSFDQYGTACTKTDTELNTVHNEMASLSRQLAVVQRELAETQKNRDQLKDALEKETVQRLKAVEDLQREKEILISQFEFEKNQMKSLAEQHSFFNKEKFTEQEQLIQALQHELEQIKRSPNGQESFSTRISEYSPFECPNEEQLSSELPTGSFATIMEHLRSKLQERERELWISREELKSMQLSRDSLVASLASLNKDKMELETRMHEYNQMREEFSKLSGSYEALLQMYGEKVEENEEIKLDLLDVKNMYKQHIEEFVNSAAIINKA